MKKYEYQTKVVDAKGLWGGKVDVTEYDQSLNEMGQQGWELIETIASNEVLGSTRYIICTFKREVESK